MHFIEAIERATLAALPPQALEERDGWLVAIDDGTVSRAHSAAPLAHAAPSLATLDAIAGRYRAAGLAPLLRLPQVAAFEEARRVLQERGYRSGKPTFVQLARLQDLQVPASAREVTLAASPDAGWEQVFLGEGFDPVDGASRLAILRRTRDSVFASVREGERTIAVGSACFSHGWCGVHGMRTAPGQRRQGLAQAVLAALKQEALERGLAQVFLQVEQGNAVAQALYARLGFATAWGYDYWEAAS